MATKRQKIIQAITDVIKTIDGTSTFESNLFGNVKPRLVFWDEVTDYPTVSVVSGTETRTYESAGLSWAFLDIKITIFVEDEDPKDKLERVFADIEKVLDANNTLSIDGNNLCTDLRLSYLSDDEGLMAPLGIGEMSYTAQYNV